MAKRFTDTDKWKRPFIKCLPMEYKLLWFYILDDCDLTGLWIVDMDVASLRVGFSFNQELVRKALGNKVVVIDEDKWFIPTFIEFQYGSKLSKTNNVFKSIDRVLAKYDLYKYLTVDITEEGETKSSIRNRVSKRVKDRILLEDEFTCQYCSEQKQKSELVIDHILPIARGGDSEDSNLITACVRCNSHKTDIMPNVFLSKEHDFLRPTNKLKGAISVLLAPKVKDKDKDKDKDLDKEEEEQIDLKQPDLFQIFWNLYGKKEEEVKCQREWAKIDSHEYAKIIEHVPKFVQASGNFLCKPFNYLDGRRWQDEQLPNYAKDTTEKPKETREEWTRKQIQRML